jgi:hypothetical protein
VTGRFETLIQGLIPTFEHSLSQHTTCLRYQWVYTTARLSHGINSLLILQADTQHH